MVTDPGSPSSVRSSRRLNEPQSALVKHQHLVPMLSLGLPTNATAAVILTAFVSYGIQPGPTLFEKEPLLIWTLIVVASLIVAPRSGRA